MKKIALLIVAVVFAITANAQFVVGVQGGYFHQKNTTDINENYTQSQDIVGGVQLGFMITPKLYFGVMGGFLNHDADSLLKQETINYEGQDRIMDNHMFRYKQSGWTVTPQLKYEFLKYGNMHFHIMLQGDIRSKGYTTMTESMNTPWRNNGELLEMDPREDSISSFTWGISLRPTLTYEFSRHLSAELSLDFLSIGYVNYTEHHDATMVTNNITGISTPIEAYSSNTTTLYAGLNTLMGTLRWENPMLRLGFNWKF